MKIITDLSDLGLGQFKVKEKSAFENYKELDSGIFVPNHYQSYPTGFDFFCGCGGFSLGFIQAGIEMIGAVEHDPAAAHTYMANLGSHPIKIHYSSDYHRDRLEQYFEKSYKKLLKEGKDIKTFEVSGSGWIKSEREAGKHYPSVKNFFFGDVREFTGAGISQALGINRGDIDIICGGPPCQGFSRANSASRSQKTHDPRNDLIFEYARMLCELQPKTFVMENVPDILNMVTPAGVPVIHQFLSIIDAGGYASYESALKALGITEKEMKVKLKYVPVTRNMRPKKKSKSKKNKTKKRSSQMGLKFSTSKVPYERS